MAKEVKKTQKKNMNKKEDNKKVLKSNEKEVVEIAEVIESNKQKVDKTEKAKRNKERFTSTLKAVDDNRKAIILFIVGFLISTLLFRCILWPDRIATLKDGTQPVATLDGKNITADDLYESMKSFYSVEVLLNDVDRIILEEMYPDSDEMEDNISNTAEYYYSLYEQYKGYTKEEFLSENKFSSEDAFLDTLRLDYRRNKYYEDYAKNLVTDNEINKYYEEDVFGDVDSKHILVTVSENEEDGLSDEDAKKLAKEIISKLNNGTSWDDVIAEYEDQITHEELGYQAFNASLESAYLEECKDLNVDTYSKTPVLTSYGYHIVYKIDQKEKPKLDDVKDDVIEVLANKKKNDDSNLYYKALITMRKEANLEFTDTIFKDEYQTYVNSYK